jgi:bacillolysin
MKILKYLFTFTLFVAALSMGAVEQKNVIPTKSQIIPQQTRPIPDLRSAGPVWKHAGPIQATPKSSGTVEKGGRLGQGVRALAFDRGLKIRDLQMAGNGTIAFISGDLGRAGQLKSATGPALTIQSSLKKAQALRDLSLAQNWLETFAPAIKINQPAAEFSLNRYESDDLGMRHLRLQQSYRGVPVWGNELYVHLDATDQVYAVNGRYAPTPAGIDPDAAGIDGTQALQLSRTFLSGLNLLRDIPADLKQTLCLTEPTSEKVIWIDSQGTAHLVWQVDMYANVRDWYTLFIDASSGAVLHTMNNTKNEGAVDASGLDLTNSTRSFRAYEDTGTFSMLSDINELSGSASVLPDSPTGGLLMIDLRNTDPSETASFYMVNSSSRTSWPDKSAVSAIYNLGLVYNYWKNTFGRRAIDNAASTILAVVNVTEKNQPMDNAYWNGRAMFYGNGDVNFTPLAEALDVTAHEVMHGVTDYTANLIYQDQSGALNESMSDFFAAMVDRNNWLIGEDIMKPGKGIAIRDIANPANPAVLSPEPVNMDQYIYTSQDNGGVHINSGIPNRAGYLVANSIGRDKAEKIYYRAMSSYLTRQSQFLDARKGLEQSAIDLYGSGAELNAVKAAFDAVGVTDSGPNPGGPGANDVLATTGGSQWIAFVRTDLQVGLYDVSGNTDYFLPGIRVMNKSGGLTQFTATADGRYLYFIDENGVLARVDLSGLPSSYNYETLDNVYINSPGDLWSAAVSRDGQYVALTSNYLNDNHVYLYLGGSLYSIPLDIPTTQEGISASTIQFPDVINWSPNTKYPKLAFDAFNKITLASGDVRTWWSIGEIDFSGNQFKLYSLLPPQADGMNVGNVQYSSTDPDRIAFSFFDVNNWDLKIVNFAETGQNQLIQFPGRDVERPSFSPDDQYIVVDRFSDNSLLVVELATLNAMTLPLSIGARNPEWFVIGGSYDLDVKATPAEQPAEFALEANYPNPFNAGTMISYVLPHSSRIHVAIYDVLGRLVQTLADGIQAAGRHTILWQGSDAEGQPLSSGIYFCRMQADNGFNAVQKMIMVK